MFVPKDLCFEWNRYFFLTSYHLSWLLSTETNIFKSSRTKDKTFFRIRVKSIWLKKKELAYVSIKKLGEPSIVQRHGHGWEPQRCVAGGGEQSPNRDPLQCWVLWYLHCHPPYPNRSRQKGKSLQAGGCSVINNSRTRPIKSTGKTQSSLQLWVDRLWDP